MSKYRERGCYHFAEFARGDNDYAHHIDDLLHHLDKHIGREIHQAYEVGCGEGLIMLMLNQRLGWPVRGSEIDIDAVNMARRFLPMTVIDLATRPNESSIIDVALFCDSLEHVDDPEAMLAWAKRAKWIVIAAPSLHDRHARRQLDRGAFDKSLSDWGVPVHRETRHARHLTIWRRHA